MLNYKLLTPGPLTTTDRVKEKMMVDHCTWDDDYKKITLSICDKLLNLAKVEKPEYTVVLMQGSGTFGVESVITSVVGKDETLLIISNGAYGERMADIAQHAGISYILYKEPYNNQPSATKVEEILKENPQITHISMVHNETTSGVLNDIEKIGQIAKKMNKTFIVDAMSSFGGMDIPVKDLGIDFIISSANKCIQGVPGFSFIICKTDKLLESEGKARSLSLDLYDQWKTMSKDGKWRFTSPTHVVLAFWQALKELEEEGGIQARAKRYEENNKYLIDTMKEMGFKPFIEGNLQGPIITTFYYPEGIECEFNEMYNYIKERGYAIYPGKLTDANTFRVGNIGEIYIDDMKKICNIIKEYMEGKRKNEI